MEVSCTQKTQKDTTYQEIVTVITSLSQYSQIHLTFLGQHFCKSQECHGDEKIEQPID